MRNALFLAALPVIAVLGALAMPASFMLPQSSHSSGDGPVATGPAVSALTFNIATLPGGGTEPSIASGNDGYIYVSAPSGLGNFGSMSSYLWRSNDLGLTWAAVPAKINTPAVSLGFSNARGTAVGGGDSDIAVGPDGIVYYTDLSGADVSVASSMDHGTTFTKHTPAAGPPGDDRQWITAPAPGTVYATAAEIGVGVWITKSTDGGQVFLPSTMLLNSQRGLVGAAPAGPLASHYAVPGTVVAGLYHASNNAVLMEVTTNGGGNWALQTIAGSAFSTAGTDWPSAAVDAAGNIYVTWTQVESGGISVYFASKSPTGGWSTPARVVASGTNVFPWIAANGAGRVALGYYHAATAKANPAQIPSGEFWSVEIAQNLDALNNPAGFGASTVLDNAVHKGGLDIAGARPLGDFFEVGSDSAGRILVAWNNDVGHAVQVRAAVQTGGSLL